MEIYKIDECIEAASSLSEKLKKLKRDIENDPDAFKDNLPFITEEISKYTQQLRALKIDRLLAD
ncbi:hypothetical protein ACFFGT_03165 [Mucilaginibacter angelicae]|uniref:Uncharacterized protein n=1 Tax=Mucilaginibacter angelicae TaxID=869718 RepID=A0ABV6L0C8_9SPHI